VAALLRWCRDSGRCLYFVLRAGRRLGAPARVAARKVAAALALAAFLAAAPAGVKRLVLDIDGDGRPDTVSLVPAQGAVTVMVRFGDPKRRAQRFRFVADPGREDAVCSTNARLRAEGKGFALVDGLCDSIHFFWNKKTHRVDWWRL